MCVLSIVNMVIHIRFVGVLCKCVNYNGPFGWAVLSEVRAYELCVNVLWHFHALANQSALIMPSSHPEDNIYST